MGDLRDDLRPSILAAIAEADASVDNGVAGGGMLADAVTDATVAVWQALRERAHQVDLDRYPHRMTTVDRAVLAQVRAYLRGQS